MPDSILPSVSLPQQGTPRLPVLLSPHTLPEQTDSRDRELVQKGQNMHFYTSSLRMLALSGHVNKSSGDVLSQVPGVVYFPSSPRIVDFPCSWS